MIHLVCALLIGKAVMQIIRIFKLGGGSAAPGLYALKICPNLVKDLSPLIPQRVVITGTNGKTTTAKMVAHFAQACGKRVLRNATGSNLERGIASALVQSLEISDILSKSPKYDLAIWELDEAAFNTTAPKINPQMIVFLNVFRDQLDRYGEVDTTVAKWCQTLGRVRTDTEIILNGNDGNLENLRECFAGSSISFGLEKTTTHTVMGEKPISNTGQKIDFLAKNIKEKGLNKVSFGVFFNRESAKVTLRLPGTYHIYDFLASFAVSLKLGFPKKKIIDSLDLFRPAFGRVEKISLGKSGKNAYIFLIKNPVGASQVLKTLKNNLKPQDRLLLALNDNFADGKDVSWIWDIEFERFKVKDLRLKIFCTGTRAEDLALRLKYADFDSPIIEKDLNRAFEKARKDLRGRLFILPTYTAMLELQQVLTHLGIKGHYWQAAQ